VKPPDRAETGGFPDPSAPGRVKVLEFGVPLACGAERLPANRKTRRISVEATLILGQKVRHLAEWFAVRNSLNLNPTIHGR